MPIQEIIEFQKRSSIEDNMKLQIAMHCSPVIRGIKVSNIMMVDCNEFLATQKFLKGTKISFRFLKVTGTKALLFLYRREELEHCLRNKRVKKFLQSQGYPEEELERMLHRLSRRVFLSINGKTEFPHEIGIFLGYPLSDVLGFLEGKKDCQYVGYWRVYNNVNSKVRLFKKYDESREEVVRHILDGKNILDMIV